MRCAASVVWFLGMMAGTASAQAGEPTELAPQQVTASRSEAGADTATVAVTVVTTAQIERQAPQTWTDLLRGQAGAFTQASGPGQGIVIVRGLKGSEVLHLVDGMRLNNSFFRNSPSQYVALVDPYNIARVELLRGSGATLYGSDAMGGVVQVFTPERRFDDAHWRAGGRAQLRYGSADLSRVTRIEAAAGDRDLSLSGGFTFMDYGERDLGDGGREDLTDYLARGYDAKLLWTPQSAHEVMLSGQAFEYPRLARYFDVVGGPGGAGEDVQSYFQPNERTFAHVRYRYLVPLAFLHDIEIHVARQRIDDERLRQPNDVRIDTEQNRSTLDGVTLQAATPVSTNTRLRYGFDLYRDVIDSAKQRTSIESGETTPAISTFPDGARQNSLGAYLRTDWRVLSRWMLDGGLRYSVVTTDLPATPVSAATDFSDRDMTWQVGSLVEITDRLAWSATAGRGFRAPNLFDLGTLGPRPGGDAEQVNVPNPDLRPETVISVDTGLRWRGERMRAEVTAWFADHDDRIESREPTGRTVAEGELGCSDADGCIEVQSRNIAQARYWGVESAIRGHTGRAGFYAVLNWTYGQELREGSPTTAANRIPPLNGQIGAVIDAGRALEVEPYVLFAGRQERLDDDDRNDTRIDPEGTGGWATVNLRIGWRASDRLRLQLDGRNLLDKEYREHGSGVDAAGAGAILSATASW